MKRSSGAQSARIIATPDVLDGKPHVEGTTADVEFILLSLRDGTTAEHLYRETGVTPDGIRAAVRHASGHGLWPSLLKAPGVLPWLQD